MASFVDDVGKAGNGNDNKTHSLAFPPPAAIFAIPTHATTHASASAFGEQTENESFIEGGDTALQGRPRPSDRKSVV